MASEVQKDQKNCYSFCGRPIDAAKTNPNLKLRSKKHTYYLFYAGTFNMYMNEVLSLY
jgi:hypothetical protein